MAILIDGYNVLHATGYIAAGATYTSLDAPRRNFLHFLSERLTPDEARDATVVFDAAQAPLGLPAETSFGDIQVLFARDHAEADDLIEELIRANHVPHKLTVVSSDHRIQRAASRRRAIAVDSDVWFWELHDREMLTADEEAEVGKRNTTLDATEVDEWLNIFNVAPPQDKAAQKGAASEPMPDLNHSPKNNPPKKRLPRRKQGPSEPVDADQTVSRNETTQYDDAMKKASKKEVFPKTSPPKRAIRRIESDPIFPPGYGEDLLEGD